MRILKRKIVFIPLILLLLAAGWYWYSKRDVMPRYQLEKLYINIDDEGFEKLEGFRDAAIDLGYLERSPDDYVKSEIIYRSRVMDGKVRLKGDWTDHLKTMKWSYRVKIKDGQAFMGLKTFSFFIRMKTQHFRLVQWILQNLLQVFRLQPLIIGQRVLL